ncbi:MAG: hypothetical protein Q4G68_10540 [Planctomycetia bacterium]|nr:hypothetical protein [Planctomycetia bacterium]
MSAKVKTKSPRTSSQKENIFFLHGEKIILSVVVLLFAWMIIGGSGLSEFKLTADQINSSAKRAEENIRNSKVTPVEVDKGVVVYDYLSYSELIRSAITVNSYETLVRWDQSLFPDRIKRPNMTPLPVENLRAFASIGAIAYRDRGTTGTAGGAADMGMGGIGMGSASGSNGKVEGRQWVTITGSIPVRKQLADYMAHFSNAQYTDMLRDQPIYLSYVLQRGTPSDAGEIVWENIDIIQAYRKEFAKWSGFGVEQVDPSYFAAQLPSYPPMAMSCPPMVNRLFGEEVANVPNIPLSSEEMMNLATTEMQERNKLEAKLQDVNMDDILSRSPFEGTGNDRSGMGNPMGMGGGGMEFGAGNDLGGMTGGGRSGGNTASWMINRNAASLVTSTGDLASPVDYYLFRAFDFDVEMGKTYYYRVKLILANPNFGLDENFVEDPTTVGRTYISSEFSESSNPVSLGRVSRIYAEQVEAPSVPGGEPRATLASVYFDSETATESVEKTLRVTRGQVANFPRRVHKPLAPAAQSTLGSDPMGMMGGPGEATGSKRKKNTQNKDTKLVDHVSDICVLDAFGGYRLPGGELRSPGKMILLEPSGLVRVHEVREDMRELGRIEAKSAKPESGMGGIGPGASML